MILMWLGSFVLLMWGLTSFQKNVGAFFSGFQKHFLEKGFSDSMVGLFAQAALVDLTQASAQKALYSGIGMFNLRILTKRPAVLLMCLSPLAALPVFVLGSTFLSFSGYFVLGICALSLLRFWTSKKVDAVLSVLFSLGIFLIGAESLLRNSRVLQTYLTESDFVFFMADGRFGAVLTLAFAAFLLSLVVQVEFWSLALSLSLLTTGTVSFNGALGILLGERLASAALFWWRTKNLNQECRKLGGQYAILMLSSSVIGFWWAGESRVYFDIGFSFNSAEVQAKSQALLVFFAIILGVQFVAGLVWGHFAGNAKSEELQEPHYFSPSWLDRDLLSEGIRLWSKDRVHKRLNEIRYHLAGLQSLKENAVPDSLIKKLHAEESLLSQLHL